MDDAFGVRRIESVGNLGSQVQHLLQRKWLAPDTVLKRYAIQELHDYESKTVLFADVVNRADVRMIECGGGFCFPPEAFECSAVVGKILRKEFQRNKTAQRDVFGLVDHAHTTAT